MYKIVLIHGMSCHLDECFGKELKMKLQEIGQYEFIEPSFALHPDITLNKWQIAIAPFLKMLDNDTIYVCHSLGTNFILKFLFKNKLKAKAILCVAGGYLKSPSGQNAYLLPFVPNDAEFEWAKNNCLHRINLFNRDDDVWTQSQIGDYNKKLGAKPIELPYGAHFGRRSGVKKIPELENILITLVK